jgi:hypothetical protein
MQSCCHPVAAGAASIDLPLIFLTGLTMSVGHCVGMCGPIQAAFCVGQNRRGATGKRLLPPLLRYHLGRILSYAVIGAALGLLGSATQLAGSTRTVQGTLSLAAAVLMFVVSAGMLGLLPYGDWSGPASWGNAVTRRIKGFLAGETGARQFGLGVANGFLPCGPVIAVALTAAAAASALVGVLLMGIYGLGTLPVLLVLGFASGRIGPKTRQRLNRLGAVLVLLVAAQLALRGLAALEVVRHLEIGRVVIW